MLNVTQFVGFGARRLAAPSGPASATYEGFSTAPSLATEVLTATACPTGVAATDRRVFAIIHWFTQPAAKSLVSVLIGGVSADIHVSLTHPTVNGGYYYGCAIVSAPLASGTTVDIEMTFATGGSVYLASVTTLRAVGLVSGVAGATANTTANANSSKALNIDVVQDGILIFGAMPYSNAGGYTISGATEVVDTSVGANKRAVAATLDVTATELARAVTLSRSGGSFYAPMVAAAFR